MIVFLAAAERLKPPRYPLTEPIRLGDLDTNTSARTLAPSGSQRIATGKGRHLCGKRLEVRDSRGRKRTRFVAGRASVRGKLCKRTGRRPRKYNVTLSIRAIVDNHPPTKERIDALHGPGDPESVGR
jgi:hypothetical protein